MLATGKLDPQAISVLQKVRELGLRTAIVSNTPWGSPGEPWRRELDRLDAQGAKQAGNKPVLIFQCHSDFGEYEMIRELNDLIPMLTGRR